MRAARRLFQETRLKQYRRIIESLEGAINFSKQHVIIPSHDFSMLLELLAKNEVVLKDAMWREDSLELLEKAR